VRGIASDVNVVTVESVQQILESNNRLNVLELAEDTLDLVSANLLQLLTSKFKGLLPVKVSERTVFLTNHRQGKSLLLEAVEGVARFIADPLLVDFFVNAG
jgi:hypothetical protein